MKRILIVDDAIELGRMLQDSIRAAYPEVSTSLVPSAEEALLESTRLTVDLLVTDLRLPGMPGTELIRKIRARQPGVRVILMTGLVEDERLEKQKQEARPDVFLHKPISAITFLDAVERLLAPALAEQEASPVGKSPQGAPAAQTPAAPVSEREIALREAAAMLPGAPAPARSKPAAPRGTGLLGAPAASPGPQEGEEGLSAILSRLRGSLGAAAVLLLDERGHSVAQAGELPDASVGEQLFPPLLSALSAGLKLSYLIGQGQAHSVQAYRAPGLEIVAAPVGPYALLVAARPGRSATRMALAVEETLEAQGEVRAALQAMGLRVDAESVLPAAPPVLSEGGGEGVEESLHAPDEQEADLEKFKELFAGEKSAALPAQEADDFWSQAASGDTGAVTPPGVLSFEQAQKLGLVPEEDDPPGEEPASHNPPA